MMLVITQTKKQDVVFLQNGKEIARIMRLEPARVGNNPRIGIEALESIKIRRVEAKER